LADGEVADVDHFLHFAFALGENLARFERDELPRSSFCSRRALPSWRTVSPRTGPGVTRHFSNA
jgi:hypothetical protein